jgi:hypothetical protein
LTPMLMTMWALSSTFSRTAPEELAGQLAGEALIITAALALVGGRPT